MIYTETYYAPGKILLAGEYTALIGLECFTFPVNKGHILKIWKINETGNSLKWKSINFEGKTWFECEINTLDFLEKTTDNAMVSGRLCELLNLAQKLNPSFLKSGTFMVESTLQFNQVFGLGSSSSLVAVIAQWAKVDFKPLQKQVFGGSGYDAAVSSLQKPLIYWLGANGQANWDIWKLNPLLTQNWHLIFLGKKVNSRQAIDELKDKLQTLANSSIILAQIDKLLQQIKVAKTTTELELGLEIWQAFLASALDISSSYQDLNLPAVKGGLCKYLGAWGGDILLVNSTFLQAYKNELTTYEIAPWNNLVINE